VSKENLVFLQKIITEDIVIEDSLGNVKTEHDDYKGGFSDLEEINEMKKMAAVASAIDSEIGLIKEAIRQQSVVAKYGIDKAESGKEWEGTPYWSSVNGNILVSDLKDNHLAKIPRHLYNNGVVKSSKDLPPKLVDEIKKRGFKLLNNCVVIQTP